MLAFWGQTRLRRFTPQSQQGSVRIKSIEVTSLPVNNKNTLQKLILGKTM